MKKIALGFLLLLAGCAHGAGERIVQHRALIGHLPSIPGERTHFAYAELRQEGEEEWRLSVHLLAPDGSRQPVVHALEEEAREAAARVEEGAPLDAVLPPYLAVGILPATPPTLPLALGPPLEGMELRLEPLEDRRYPRNWVLRLHAGEDHAELCRVALPPGATLRLVALTPDAAALALHAENAAARIVDVRAVDLLAGGRALLVEQGRKALDVGDFERAANRLWRAELLDAPDEGELHFEKARLYALRGEATERVVSALARALPFEPALYRMRARTEPAFAALKEEASFVQTVAPRPLPGRDRAIQVSSPP